MRTLFREPLLHFGLIAALIFSAHAVMQSRARTADRTILISTSELERLAGLYAAEAGTLPGADDLQGLVADHVRREALAREARRLGLDENDLVVDRRLEQKMSFMVADLIDIAPAGDDVLKAWYDAHGERFREPAHITFEHVFFRDRADPDISAVSQQLTDMPDSDWRALGDPFMLQRQYGDLPLREITRIFGGEFAAAIATLETGPGWSAPVPSALGTHLVRITSKTDASLPAFETIRPAVQADWQDAQRRAENERAIADILSNYDVVIEGDR